MTAADLLRPLALAAPCVCNSVRFRTDLDVLLIVHFLASLDALVGVALPALHCALALCVNESMRRAIMT